MLQTSKVQDCIMHTHRPNTDFGLHMLFYTHQLSCNAALYMPDPSLTMCSFAPTQGSTFKFQSIILHIYI